LRGYRKIDGIKGGHQKSPKGAWLPKRGRNRSKRGQKKVVGIILKNLKIIQASNEKMSLF